MRLFYKTLFKNKEYVSNDGEIYYIDAKWRKKNVFAGHYSYNANIIKFTLKKKTEDKLIKLGVFKFEYKLDKKDINLKYCFETSIEEYKKNCKYAEDLKRDFNLIE